MKLGKLAIPLFCVSTLVACGSSRDVEVAGELSAPDGVDAAEPIRVEFYEPVTEGEGEEAQSELELVHDVTLEELGSFDETVALEGDELYVIAFADGDEDESCTDGEPWGEAMVTVDEDDTASVSIAIAQRAACPAL